MAAGVDGYFDGLCDANGNLTDYGQEMVRKGYARRSGDGAILINGGVAQAGSANNPDGAQKNPDGTNNFAGMPGGTPTPAAGALPTANSTWTPGGMIIGDDGTAWLEIRHWDPTKQDYVYQQVELGNPNTAGFDWNNVAAQTGLPQQQLRAEYTKQYTEWRQTQAAAKALGTWHYDSIDPTSGLVTVKNGAGEPNEVDLRAIVSPEWRAAHQGVNLQDVQQAVQQLNRSNWLNSTMTTPGTAGYAVPYYYTMGGPTAGTPVNAPAAAGTPAVPPTAAVPPPAPGMAPGGSAYHNLMNQYGPVASGQQSAGGGQQSPLPAAGVPTGSTLTGGGTTGNNPAAAKAAGGATNPADVGTITPAMPALADTAGRGGGATGATPGAATGRPGGAATGTPATPGTPAVPATGGSAQYGGKTVEQAQQEADQAQIGKILASLKQYQNIEGTDAGAYTASDFYGNRSTLTKDQLIASGSATASDLYKQQLAYADLIRRYGQQARGSRSQFLGGFNPNQLSSSVAGA